jgi:PKD repeat protein
MLRRIAFIGFCLLVFLYLTLLGAVPSTLDDFFMPGSQPNESGNLESPDKCDNCHGGYDIAVEPAFNWRGSMMSQAARDPLLYACMAIGNQDAPDVGDLCLRCHTPPGWLEGRSVPTDGSALTSSDREGVQCDFCHKLVKPTAIGVNPYPDDPDYTADTYPADQSYLSTLSDIPPQEANGMYVADNDNAKRGPFVDADAKHQFFYSPFHSEAALCGTCHDVSNPAFTRVSGSDYAPNDFGQQAPDFSPYAMFPIERTYSEWLKSDYNSPAGVYAPQFGGNKDYVSTCQDCHLRDVTGVGCNKQGVPVRDDLPLHDMTGGNTFIPTIIDSVFPGETSQEALDSGMVRATRMLHMAADLSVNVTDLGSGYEVQATVTNETGHKLPSGYPEGRRIWLNVQAYDTGENLIYESGAYDTATGVLTHDADAKIYEIKPGISGSLSPVVSLPAGPSFHFVINDTVYSDNRIPPRGFTNAAYDSIQSPPVGYSYADGQYWDDTYYSLPATAARVIVNLYYQTTSKEYVEFLRDENVTNDWGTVLYNLWMNNGMAAPVAMSSDTVILQSGPANQPPALSDIPETSVLEGDTLHLSVTATDPDGDSLILSALDVPENASFTDNFDNTGTFDFYPDYAQAGLYTVTFIASDGELADTEQVSITVVNVNRAPVLSEIGPQSVDEGSHLSVPVSATDADGDSLILSADGVPTNATFVDNFDGTGTFTFDPDFDQAGTYPVTFVASDGELADTEQVSITVVNVNRAPVLSEIGPQSVDEGSHLSFPVTATDVDGDSLVLSADGVPTNATFVDNFDGTGTFTFDPDFDQAGTYPVTFIASDGGLADTEQVSITVVNVNRAPVLSEIGPQSVDEGSHLSFPVTATDVDGDSLILSADGVPTNATFVDNFDGTGTFTFDPDFDQAGTYPVTFIASDGALADSESVTITVNDVGHSPVITPIDPQEVNEGETLDFAVIASDPDGDSLILSALDVPDNASFTDNFDNTGSFDFSPDYTQAGSYPVTFIASDGALADTEQVSITVINVNRAPVLTAIEPQTVDEGANLSFLVEATDPDNDALTLSADNVPVNASFSDNHNGTGSFDFNPDYNQAGNYTVSFIADDGDLADTSSVSITVTNVNRPPILNPVGDQTVVVGVLLSFDVTAYDLDDDSVGLIAAGLPTGATFTDNGWDSGLQEYYGSFQWIPTSGQEGDYSGIVFSAFDVEDTTSDTISIHVSSQELLCGDADGNGVVNISDAVYLVGYIFGSGPAPSPLEQADCDCSGTVNIADAVYLIAYIFGGGPEPCASCP